MEQIPTETFADYMGNARNKFVNDIQQQKWNTELRTSAEDILIAYDQMRKRIEECEGKEKEIAELKRQVNDLTMDNMTHEYNQAEAERTWPQFKQQIIDEWKTENNL